MSRGVHRPVVYISGPITGMDNYKERFGMALSDLLDLDCVGINPADLPRGLTNAQYMRICHALMECADVVLLLPGWKLSKGAQIEQALAVYSGIPCIEYPLTSPRGARQLALDQSLFEALNMRRTKHGDNK